MKVAEGTSLFCPLTMPRSNQPVVDAPRPAALWSDRRWVRRRSTTRTGRGAADSARMRACTCGSRLRNAPRIADCESGCRSRRPSPRSASAPLRARACRPGNRPDPSRCSRMMRVRASLSAGASRGRSSLPFRGDRQPLGRADAERAAVRQHRILQRLDDFGAIRLVRVGQDRIDGAGARSVVGRRRRAGDGPRAGDTLRCAREARARSERRVDLQLDALQRLLEVGIARRLDVRLQRAQRAVEPEVVLVERPQAPRQRRFRNDGTMTSKKTP